MCLEVEDYVIKCQTFQVNKIVGLWHSLDIPNNKWECISMDFIVSLPHTQKVHDAIWVVVDRLMKMAKFIPTKYMVTIVNELF